MNHLLVFHNLSKESLAGDLVTAVEMHGKGECIRISQHAEEKLAKISTHGENISAMNQQLQEQLKRQPPCHESMTPGLFYILAHQ